MKKIFANVFLLIMLILVSLYLPGCKNYIKTKINEVCTETKEEYIEPKVSLNKLNLNIDTSNKSLKGKIVFGRNINEIEYFLCVVNFDNNSLLEISPFPLKEFKDSLRNLCKVSPDRTKIVFTFFNGKDKDIYVVGIDGKNLINLSKDHVSNDEYPSFSPDGERIVFVKNINNKREIYLMNNNGTNIMNLSNSPESDDYYPIFSIDCKKLFFLSDRDGNKEIYSVNTDGTNLRNLTKDSEDERFFELSPNGKIIAYSSFENEEAKICLMNTDGTNKKVIIYGFDEQVNMEWSPDSKRLAITGKNLGDLHDIFLVNQDGSNFHNFTKTTGYKEFFGYWSPSGSKFTFKQYESDLWVDSVIFVVDVITEKYKAIECPLDHCWENGGEFSLDEKKILYGICIDRGTWDLCLADEKGKFLKRLTETKYGKGMGITYYEWLDSSNWIAYIYHTETISPTYQYSSKLFVENIDSGEKLEICSEASEIIDVIH